jgi:hypothetical protein
LPAATFSSPAAADPLESLVSGKLAILEVSLKQVEEEIEETAPRFMISSWKIWIGSSVFSKESLLQVAPHGNMTAPWCPRRRSR